jgi:hypothetical protein
LLFLYFSQSITPHSRNFSWPNLLEISFFFVKHIVKHISQLRTLPKEVGMSFSWQSACRLQGFPPIYFPTGFLLNYRNAKSKYIRRHIHSATIGLRKNKPVLLVRVALVFAFDWCIRPHHCTVCAMQSYCSERAQNPYQYSVRRCALAQINKCAQCSGGRLCGKSVSRRKYYFLAADQFSLWALRPPHISTTLSCRRAFDMPVGN